MNAPIKPRDVPWTGTGGLSDTQSYAWIILNAIYDRLTASSLFANFTCKRINTALPLQAEIQVPFIGIFLGEEVMIPDGDENTGDIRFIHQIPIGIQIVVKNNDATAMLAKLDQASWFVLNQLFRDDSFTNRFQTTLPDKVPFEGIPRVNFMRDVWGTVGDRNETPVGQRMFFIAFKVRTWFAPTEFPDLKRITVTTAFPLGDPDEQSKVQQVKVVYEFDPDSVPTPLPPDP